MPPAETVVLVHGLWMHGLAMRLMQRRIGLRGYATFAYSYPTMRLTLYDNAERLWAYCNAVDGKVHFVGHSMGGLVAMAAARLVTPERRGRVVLIGTPFADCVCGRQLERFAAGRRLLGKCMAQWLHEAVPALSDGLEVGVIAGDGGFGLGRIIAPRLPKPHDGVISVAETHVPGMRDHVTLAVSHTAMLVSRPVVRAACAFLEQGRFARAAHDAL